MPKTILFAVALLLLGGAAGNSIARYSAAQHQHTRAVMALAQFHFERLSAAAKSGVCSDFVEERERLFRVYAELLEAFPKTYAQDAEFRRRAEAFRDAVHPDLAATGECGSAAADARKIDQACDACHQEYR
jgi:cytochrome c556